MDNGRWKGRLCGRDLEDDGLLWRGEVIKVIGREGGAERCARGGAAWHGGDRGDVAGLEHGPDV